VRAYKVRIYTHVDEREDRVGGPRYGTEARRRSPRSVEDRLIVTRDRDRYFFFLKAVVGIVARVATYERFVRDDSFAYGCAHCPLT
jgi:hypothetical protein